MVIVKVGLQIPYDNGWEELDDEIVKYLNDNIIKQW